MSAVSRQNQFDSQFAGKRSALNARRKQLRGTDLMMAVDAVDPGQTRGGQAGNARTHAVNKLNAHPDRHSYIGLCAKSPGLHPNLIAYKSGDEFFLASVESVQYHSHHRLLLNGQVSYSDRDAMIKDFESLSSGHGLVLYGLDALEHVKETVLTRPGPGCFWIPRSWDRLEEIYQKWTPSSKNLILESLEH